MKKERSYNFLLVAGSALILLAVILIVMTLAAVSPDKITVLVPKANIAPYSGLSEDDFIAREVPKTEDSSTETEFTQDWLEDNFKDGDDTEVFFATVPLLAGQRVDNRVLLDNPQRGLTVVLGDESVITVTTTDAGAIGRSLRPGNVVNVTANDDNIGVVTFAKVLAIGPATQVSEVITGQGDGPAGDEAADEEGVGQLLVVLSVPQEGALDLAGKDVVMSLIPFCTVSDQGYFEAVGNGTCEPPEDRLASSEAPATGDEGTEGSEETEGDTPDAGTEGTEEEASQGDDGSGDDEQITGGDQPAIEGDLPEEPISGNAE